MSGTSGFRNSPVRPDFREFDFAREYFPKADIHEVDGTNKPADVAE
jgi:hypothetical protein